MERAKASQISDFPDGIQECGADALRFGLLAYTVQGRDVNLDIKRVVGYRQFCNKIWNAVRFLFAFLDDFTPGPTMHLEIAGNPHASPRDLFILSRLNNVIQEANRNIEQFVFGVCASALHSFFMYDFCDVYVELVKPVLNNRSEENADRRRCTQCTLYTCVEQYLRLLHPLMPFVTEELWQRLPFIANISSSPSIMVAQYPQADVTWNNTIAENAMTIIKEAIHSARSLRSDYNIPNNMKADFYFSTANHELRETLISQEQDFCTLAKGNFLKPSPSAEMMPRGLCIKVVSDQLSIYINLEGIIDIDSEVARLRKEEEKLNNQIGQYRKKIEAPGYETKVPETVRATNKDKLEAYEKELDMTIKAIENFLTMK